ncbi:MAG: hypothetical protein KA369_13705 [Spirochaetes bacterium]|nr:hypothetical protein [Spirochaetota bacterium]
MAGSFIWPKFDEPVEIVPGVAWTAVFDSYDQRNECCYYRILVRRKGGQVQDVMAQVDVGWAGDDWTNSRFREAIKGALHAMAVSGKSNTGYGGYDAGPVKGA